MNGRRTMQFLSVKAFGDFVIAATSLERVAPADRAGLSILAADHLRPLASALAPACDITFLGNAEQGVPALFDVRRAGICAAIGSAIGLRRAVRQVRDPDAALILDKDGWRARWLGFPSGVETLSPAGNIYAAYDDFLASRGIARAQPVPGEAASKGDGAIIGLFPGSRVAAKNLPEELVRTVLAAAARSGRCARLFLLEGERPDLERSGLPFEGVPRCFEALIAAIGSVGSVIGADSLPVHLAERAGRRVFVLSPKENIFWLPRSSLVHDRWALFGAALDIPLARFLDVE